MFGQLFLFIIGIISLFFGIQDGDYLWAFCGLLMTLSGVDLIYQLTTGKSLWHKLKLRLDSKLKQGDN